MHPGGPYWAKKDEGAWTIPKGLHTDVKTLLDTARREFEEETGCTPPDVAVELGRFRQPSGKVIHAWAAEGDFDLASFRSNLFSMEWPPRSGRTVQFPEVDKAAWLEPKMASLKILKGQVPILRAWLRQVHSHDLLT